MVIVEEKMLLVAEPGAFDRSDTLHTPLSAVAAQ